MENHTPIPADKSLLAAIDLGSNSFRLEIGRLDSGHIERVEYLKEAVRQGGGLDEDRNLTPEAIERGLKCLARFGERLKGFDAAHVRAVARKPCARPTTAKCLPNSLKKRWGLMWK